MKLDANEKELLESVERGEWNISPRWEARAGSLLAIREGDVPP